MLFILSGEILTYLLSEEGREVTLFRLYPGELCVLSASCVISQITFDTQMTAGMDTEADKVWNEQHFGGAKSVAITGADVKIRATFYCDLIDTTTRQSLL